jgi:hypothetical protein
MDQMSESFDSDAIFAANQANTFDNLEGNTIADQSVPEADLNAQMPTVPGIPSLMGSQDAWMYVGGPEASSNVQVPNAELPVAGAPQEAVYDPRDWDHILGFTQDFEMSGTAPEANLEPQTANLEPLMAGLDQAGIYTSEEFNALLQYLRAEPTGLTPQLTPSEIPGPTVEAANAALNNWFITRSSNSGGDDQNARTFISGLAQNDTGVPLAQSPDMADAASEEWLYPAAGHLPASIEGFRGGSVGLAGAHHDFAADPRFVHQSGAVYPQNQHPGLPINRSLQWMSFPGSNLGQNPAAQPENQDSTEGPQPMGLAAPVGAPDGAPDGASNGASDAAIYADIHAAIKELLRSSPERRSDTTPESHTTGHTTPNPNPERGIARDAGVPAPQIVAQPAAQDVPEPNQHQEEPKTAKKVAIACQRCKQRKTKCDAATPRCSCCAKAGEANCEYAAAVRKRGRAKGSINKDITEKKQFIATTEAKKDPGYLQIVESAQNELRELEEELSQSTGKERTKAVKASTSGSKKGKKKA